MNEYLENEISIRIPNLGQDELLLAVSKAGDKASNRRKASAKDSSVRAQTDWQQSAAGRPIESAEADEADP